jgi:hypothetical protein
MHISSGGPQYPRNDNLSRVSITSKWHLRGYFVQSRTGNRTQIWDSTLCLLFSKDCLLNLRSESPSPWRGKVPRSRDCCVASAPLPGRQIGREVQYWRRAPFHTISWILCPFSRLNYAYQAQSIFLLEQVPPHSVKKGSWTNQLSLD